MIPVTLRYGSGQDYSCFGGGLRSLSALVIDQIVLINRLKILSGVAALVYYTNLQT